jgi:hypothetical protein
MYNGLSHAHSGLRWVLLALLILAIVNSFSRKEYAKKDRLIYLFTMIFAHVQLTLGIVMYFISPKVQFVSGMMKEPMWRFYGVEHLIGMILAVVLLTIGKKKSESTELPGDKHGRIRLYYTVSLILIIAFIPWPMREALGGSWY